jgi:WD40 repeat protein
MTSERTRGLCGCLCRKVGSARSLFEVVRYDIRRCSDCFGIFDIVSFSCVNQDGTQVLSAAASTGHIALWDLDSGGKLLHVIRGAHEGAATAIEWIPGQPILVSSGEDNSVKVGTCDCLLPLTPY